MAPTPDPGRGEPRFPFVAVDVASAESERVTLALFDLGATGVEERDDHTMVRGPSGGKVTVVASFATQHEAEHAMAELRALEPALAPQLEEIVGDAWRDAWKEHFAPFALTPHVTVAPPWAKCAAKPGETVLVLEPGRAFGTGLHATTALVADVLDARSPGLAGQDVLDVGTGSGILSLVALLLGAARAVAIDVDADVIDVVRENAARNELAHRIEVRACGVESITRAFPWVLANIEARVLRPIAPELARVVAPGGVLVLSGILDNEHDELCALYTSVLAKRLTHLETLRRDEWVAIVLGSADPPKAGRENVNEGARLDDGSAPPGARSEANLGSADPPKAGRENVNEGARLDDGSAPPGARSEANLGSADPPKAGRAIVNDGA